MLKIEGDIPFEKTGQIYRRLYGWVARVVTQPYKRL